MEPKVGLEVSRALKDYEQFQERFRCPKCNNRASIPREVSLSRVKEKILGVHHAEKYLILSCSLCGYSEMYNLKVAAQADQEEQVREGVPEPNETSG